MHSHRLENFFQRLLSQRKKDSRLEDFLLMFAMAGAKSAKVLEYSKLIFLSNVGLGYIHLGQPATTLSGGESQRIKLAAELSKKDTGNTVYILDEPTTGLHFADVSKLLHVLQQLVDLGNSVIVIEHNLDVIASADWIIDLGPEGGELGGRIVACGTPEEISRNDCSQTGKYLKSKLFPKQILNTMIREQDSKK